MGRKKVSYSSASRIRTAMGRREAAKKESSDVERAEETLTVLIDKHKQLITQVEEGIAELEDSYATKDVELVEITIKPKSTEILIHFVALAWAPFDRDSKGRLTAVYG